jgi:hypothetical protein
LPRVRAAQIYVEMSTEDDIRKGFSAQATVETLILNRFPVYQIQLLTTYPTSFTVSPAPSRAAATLPARTPGPANAAAQHPTLPWRSPFFPAH